MSTLTANKPRILPESLRYADGGTVECTVLTAAGPVQGVIENSFFEEFAIPQPPRAPQLPQGLSAQHRLRIVQQNLSYLEDQAAYQLRLKGYQPFVIK